MSCFYKFVKLSILLFLIRVLCKYCRFVSANTVSNLPKWIKTMVKKQTLKHIFYQFFYVVKHVLNHFDFQWRSPARVNLQDELKEFVRIQKIEEEERLNT